MTEENKNNKEKTLFKSFHCGSCRQAKPCGKLSWGFCCPCQFKMEQEKAEGYFDYQQVHQRKVAERKASYQQYQLLKGYPGCPQCGSLDVDAYGLYNENELICQPCLARKEGSSSSPISFWEWQKWFKRLWKIDLREWLEKFQCLPVNADCAREWAKDRNHLASCQCLEIEAEKHYSLVNENLKVSRTKFRECQCVKSKKVRVSGDYYAWCDICEEGIKAASKKRVVKNRNDPRFWGLEVSEKILCGDCLVRFRVKMPAKRRAKFTEYRKLGMFE